MSANPTNVLPFPGGLTLEQLAEALVQAKRDEDAAKARRVNLETQIVALQPAKQEGALTVPAGGYKLTITGSLNYAADDLDALREITRTWDSNLVPLSTKTELSASGCKWLREHRPDLWTQLAAVITVKPAKTSVKVSV